MKERRSEFYGQYAGHTKGMLKTPEPYWTTQNTLSIDRLILSRIFPMSDAPGASVAGLKTLQMQQNAELRPPMKGSELKGILEKHHRFLSTGGAGGKWETVHVSGLVLGIYTGAKAREGEQANLDRKHIPDTLELTGIPLPFANFCGCFAKGVDFSEADLSSSLFTDSMLENSNFGEANLDGVDFSRANLRNACFMNANLTGTDFENCDLTGADFTGAILTDSRFPGADLTGVKY